MRIGTPGCHPARSSFEQNLILLYHDATDAALKLGAVAQLGERMNGIHEVRGSIPLGSTTQISNDSVNTPNWLWQDWVVALLLFLATAAVVIWQNSRLGVLWDLSYILENSYRISLGDLPYRDFPFPYPPLTFLIQAAIIKIGGRVFWHTIIYSTLMGGVATVLTWRILLNLLREKIAHARWLALILSLPLIVLGIYCVYPHPFYDPDCTLAILVGLLLLQRLERKPPSSGRSLLTGGVLIVPLFIKQNTGLVFLGATGLALSALVIIEVWRRRSARKYIIVLLGATLAFGLALLLIHFTAGLGNYWHWTIQFAAARRTPARSEMLGIYQDKVLLLWIGLIFLGVAVFRINRRYNPVLNILSAILLAAPFIWPAIYLLRDHDPSERAERLIGIWPILLIVCFITAIALIKRRSGAALIVPFILIATTHGAFMSQQLWGSTYAIWPLFVILLASTLAGISSHRSSRSDPQIVTDAASSASQPANRLPHPQSWFPLLLTGLIVVPLLISGGFYVWSHERLDYANLDDGVLTRSKLPQLQGLSVRGDWLPDFEELISYVNREIPTDEGLLIIPGEDLFYYTTGRRPQFPVLLFDHTVNPYSADEILKLARERNIRWLIVKQDLQDEDEQLEKQRDELTEAFEQEFDQVESLKNYDIYRRSESGKSDEDDNDK